MNTHQAIGCFAFLILLLASCREDRVTPQGISNGQIHLTLHVRDQVPYLKSFTLKEDEQPRIFDGTEGRLLRNWVTGRISGEDTDWSCRGWRIEEDSVFVKATASVILDEIRLEYHVDLVKNTPYFRHCYTIENTGDEPVRVPEFPALMASYGINDTTSILRWWEALSYAPHEEQITMDTEIILRSKVHSSMDHDQTPGNVPYWYVRDERGTLYHAIAWCGGWQANFKRSGRGLNTRVFLNRMETQLELKPGESVQGPEIYILATHHTKDMPGRKAWFEARQDLASSLYPVPDMGFPFIYNHWYSVEFNIDETFIRNQVEPIRKYDFDVFMIDAGWYEDVGSWTPDRDKFSPGSFTGAIHQLNKHDVTVGLWSCPQLKTIHGNEFPAEIDRPGLHVGYMDAWLIDFTGSDFTRWLNLHIDTLVNLHGAGWWKFDQDFFGRHSRHGKIRNVHSLQNAVASVRRNYPDLVIEACMGGGKMVNEFTDMISQIHWIRDGERSGYMHAISNIREAMGATEFLAPAKVQRWNNRLDEVDATDPEILRFYLRSCMLGTWGISTDLDKLTRDYDHLIANELQHYRKINKVKKHNLFDHEVPREYTGDVYAIYYNEDYTAAALLLYRMFKRDRPVNRHIRTALKPGNYRIINVDGQDETIIDGSTIPIHLDRDQLSTIYFIEEVN